MSRPSAELLLSAQPALRLDDGRQFALAPRVALLLAWLAIEGATTRTRLATLLWPDADPAAARNVLRQRLFHLRRQVGLDLVEGQATLRLSPAIVHDLEDADDLLAGCDVDAGSELGSWITLQRRRRRERLRQSLSELSTMAEQARDWDDALAHARELAALDPLSEAAHRRLIRLHYLAGDRAAALQAFDACERMLKDEVGTRPSPETMALLATVESSSPAQDAPLRAVPAALMRPPRLLGREAERAALALALRERRTVLLRGEPGMGKSRLLAALADDTAGRLVRVGARPGDALVPCALAGRWLRALLDTFGLEPEAPQRAALARLLPELGATDAMEPAALAAALESQFGLAVACGLAGVVVDDLQFSDAASLALLQPLAERGDAAWVLALRPAELDATAQAFCASLSRRSDTVVLDLPPLGADAVAALLDGLDITGPDVRARAVALHARTGGNPLYVLETVKAAMLRPVTPADAADAGDAWPAAPGVLRLIQQRLARLGAPAMRLARCAAIAGQDLRPELVAAVLAVPVLDLADAWAELEAAQVLRGERFAHDLIAEAAAASVPAAVARPLHAEVAAWLEARGGEPARVAAHWLAAGQDLRAVPALTAAARQAARLWQHEAAGDLDERAGDLLRAAGRAAEAFDAYLRAAEARTALRVDGRVHRLSERLDALATDDAQRAWAACVRIALLAEQRRFADARALAEQALQQARRAGAADAEVELLWSLTVLDWDRRELSGAVQHAHAALTRLADVDPGTQRIDLADTHLKLLHALGVFQGSLGHYAESDRWLEQAIEAASRRRGMRSVLHIAATLAFNALEQGDAARALRWSAEAIADDDRDDAGQNMRANTLVVSATVHACGGEPAMALDLAERAVALCDRGLVRLDVVARWRLAWLQAELGRRDLALHAWRALAARGDLHGPDRPRVMAALLGAGEPLPAGDVLDRIAALDDFPLRATLLCMAQPGCPPASVLPLLAMTAAAARDQGARGVWLAVQGRRAAALSAAGRHAEAHEVACAAWAAVEEGVTGIEPFGRTGTALAVALQRHDPSLAATVARRVSTWRQRAAAALPPAWRDAFLRPAARGATLPNRPNMPDAPDAPDDPDARLTQP